MSPIIQAGLEFAITKNAPMHLLPEAFVIIKSAELILQLLPPNERVTFTLVLQAERSFEIVDVDLGSVMM